MAVLARCARQCHSGGGACWGGIGRPFTAIPVTAAATLGLTAVVTVVVVPAVVVTAAAA